MDRPAKEMTSHEQELLDSGLRMLAHMIVETHIRRTAPNVNGKRGDVPVVKFDSSKIGGEAEDEERQDITSEKNHE